MFEFHASMKRNPALHTVNDVVLRRYAVCEAVLLFIHTYMEFKHSFLLNIVEHKENIILENGFHVQF